MEWVDADQLGLAYGYAIAAGLLLGGLVAAFNSWRA